MAVLNDYTEVNVPFNPIIILYDARCDLSNNN